MTEILDQLEINKTFFYQFVLFGVFFFVLSAIYLKPFQKLLERRNKKLNDEVQGARDLIQSVENRLNDYERELSRVRSEALKGYELAMQQVRAKEDIAINAIKDELKKDYAKANDQLQAEKAKVEAELQTQVAQMSDMLAQKVMGGTAAGNLSSTVSGK